MFCLKNVNLKRPRTRLTNSAIFNALESDLIPALLGQCNVIAARAIFSAESQEDVVLQIAARRRAIEKKLMESQEVRVIHFLVFENGGWATETKNYDTGDG